MFKTILFTSAFSIADSILTLEPAVKDAKAETLEEPISIFTIAKRHELPFVTIVDNCIDGYWKAYKNSKGLPVRFGVKMQVRQAKEQPETASNLIFFIRNSQGYTDMVPILSRAGTEGYDDGRATLLWDWLTEMVTPNIKIAVPFYSGFIARNLTNFGWNAVPRFPKPPTFFLESHHHYLDVMIREATIKYCESEGFVFQETHSVYYYKREHAKKLQAFKADKTRGTLSDPKLDGFCSSHFDFLSQHAKE